MRPEIKFCGLTRAQDAAAAAALGARYAGVVFAGGPRCLDPEQAATVFAGAPGLIRVGVFGRADSDTLDSTIATAKLDVIQLHEDPTIDDVRAVRAGTGCAVWAVLRLCDGTLPLDAAGLFAEADAVLLDTRVQGGTLGGTGVPFPWADVAAGLQVLRARGRLVLAGGLTPLNVARAVATLDPDVVDVSSGVESAPGVKDPAKMRAFAEAVWA